MKKMEHLDNIKGYSFIEIFFSMALLALVTGLGAASLSALLCRNELQSLIDELKAVIEYAKIQALAHNQVVLLRARDASNWANGLELMMGKKTLHCWTWHYGKWHMTWKGVHSSKGIFFAPNPLQAMSNGRFSLHHPHQKTHKVIILNRIGRIKVVP